MRTIARKWSLLNEELWYQVKQIAGVAAAAAAIQNDNASPVSRPTCPQLLSAPVQIPEASLYVPAAHGVQTVAPAVCEKQWNYQIGMHCTYIPIRDGVGAETCSYILSSRPTWRLRVLHHDWSFKEQIQPVKIFGYSSFKIISSWLIQEYVLAYGTEVALTLSTDNRSQSGWSDFIVTGRIMWVQE
jgi:hypothetical protein